MKLLTKKSQLFAFVLGIMISLPFRESCGGAFAARLVLNNNAYFVINKGAYLVIDTSSTFGITTLGTGGDIISEADTNRVKWNIGTATGTYTIPFSHTDGTKIPFTFNVTAAGTGSGNLTLSTYYTDVTATPNNRPLPTGVTNLNNSSGSENDIYVADRFWRVDVNSYTSNPTADLVFTYRDAEWNTSRNTITETTLQAQRWDGSAWYPPVGTNDAALNTVTVTGVNTFSPWTLVSNLSPLPIELLYFTAVLTVDKQVLCQWATATEINNDYFTIEKTMEGINYETIGKMKGAGNSSSTLYYSMLDENPYSGTSYYRLKQTDYDGKYEYSQLVPVNLEGIEIIAIYPNPVITDFEYLIGSVEADDVQVLIIDAEGRKVMEKTETINKGLTKKRINVSEFSSGSYILQIVTSNNRITQKQFLK